MKEKKTYLTNEELRKTPINKTRAEVGKSLFKFSLALAAGIATEVAIAFIPLPPVAHALAFSTGVVAFSTLLKSKFGDMMIDIKNHFLNKQEKEIEKRVK